MDSNGPYGADPGRSLSSTTTPGGTVNDNICKAVIAIKGEWFGCDEPNLTHPIHGSTEAGTIWVNHDEALALPSAVERPRWVRSRGGLLHQPRRLIMRGDTGDCHPFDGPCVGPDRCRNHGGIPRARQVEVGARSTGVRVPDPIRCSISDDGCTVRAESCTCTYLHGCGEDEPGCCFCAHLDVYLPCPTFGFGCGPDCQDEDCCTSYQRRQVFRMHEHFRLNPVVRDA